MHLMQSPELQCELVSDLLLFGSFTKLSKQTEAGHPTLIA